MDYMNLPRIFLQSYDACLGYYPADVCRQKVIAGAPIGIDVYLKTYENCRPILGPERCQTFLAPDQKASFAIPLLAIGFIIGAVFGKER